MGVSIPAVAYPLRADGTADTGVKPQPVTLFFGIIDFLQALFLPLYSISNSCIRLGIHGDGH